MMMKLFNSPRVPLKEEQFINSDTARFYDEHARRFMIPVYRQFAAKVAKINLPAKRVLDIGTGSGLLAIELAKARPDWQIIGTDISDEMLKLARENAKREGQVDRIDFWQYSAEALPFEDDYFGLVVSNASLHLWTDPIKIFKEIARVTAPGGYCLIWDNLRLTALFPFLRGLGWVMGMNKEQRQLWLQAIQSSYNINEAKTLIIKSVLQDARVTINPGLLELCIQWHKH
jgi:ubiquinone/menaquinone biosynthesis C-methylase UbiE